MNDLLTGLGISAEIQALFCISADLRFSYGDDFEHYGEGFHKVPTTANLWMAGSDTAREIVITHSAMEAIAFLSVNRRKYRYPAQLAFIAVGNRLHPDQITYIRQRFPKRRFTLAFGNDLIGRITDVKIAAGILDKPLRIYHVSHRTLVQNIDRMIIFDDEKLSLSAFMKAFGFRPPVRTRKSLKALTYLDQLKNDTLPQ